MTISHRWTVYGQAEPEARSVRNRAETETEAWAVRDMAYAKALMVYEKAEA